MARARLKRTVKVDGMTATFEFMARERPHWIPGQYKTYKGRDGKTHSYRTDGHMSCHRQDYTKKPRVFVDTSGETLLDDLMNRDTRPVNVWGRALRKAMAALELEGRVNWSQHAGCSCPCSPGFVWTNAPAVAIGDETTTKYDVWVTLTNVPVKRDDAQAKARQRARGTAVLNDPTMPVSVAAIRL